MTDTGTLPLDTPEQPNPPPRPAAHDPAIIEAVARDLMPAVIEWLGSDYDGNEATLLDDLRYACEYWHEDGYERCKRLENKHWDCNFELAEIMDGASHSSVVRAATKVWVTANGITPKLAVGTAVEVTHANQMTDTGTIVAIHPETAEYVVQTTDYLSRFGTGTPPQPQSGYLIPFERVRAMVPVNP